MSDRQAAGGGGLWGGRVSRGPAPALERLNRSLPFDARLWPFELEIDRAWVEELVRCGALDAEEGARIQSGLEAVGARLRDGDPAAEPDEDIHSLIERWLTEQVGPVASQVRLGRSRNDVVATAGRMWATEACVGIHDRVLALQKALLASAERFGQMPFPLYSHMQPAQPTRAANWLLGYFWTLERGRNRLVGAVERMNCMPLGTAAGAGSAIPIDRTRLAERLGFTAPCPNGLDSVGARDWAAEIVWAWTMTAIDLSRLAEDIVFYSSAEFGLLRLADEWTTGSSLMPQKRNPDGAELARATGGAMLGLLTGLLATLKGLPAGYQKDLQEDKRALFDAEARLSDVLEVLTGSVETMELDPDRAAAGIDPSVLASDVAELLALRGVPFRTAHDTVARLVNRAEQLDVSLAELPRKEVEAIEPALADAWEGVFDLEQALDRRQSEGGSSTEAIAAQIEAARDRVTRASPEELRRGRAPDPLPG